MCIPAHSFWLPGYMNVDQTVLITLTMAGLFPDRLHFISSPRIILFYSMLFHYKIDEENISSQLGPPCVVCMVSPYLCGFSLDVMASSHISTMCMLGELMCWNSSRLHECEYGEWPCMERQPVLAGSHLEPWAARRGSGHPKPWSRISRLEENSLILLIFLELKS